MLLIACAWLFGLAIGFLMAGGFGGFSTLIPATLQPYANLVSSWWHLNVTMRKEALMLEGLSGVPLIHHSSLPGLMVFAAGAWSQRRSLALRSRKV